MPRRNAPESFFFRGTGLPTVMRKNQPLVPLGTGGGGTHTHIFGPICVP